MATVTQSDSLMQADRDTHRSVENSLRSPAIFSRQHIKQCQPPTHARAVYTRTVVG